MYVQASRLPDPQKGPGEVYRGELNAEVRARIRASSVHWGEEALRWGGWVSVFHVWDGSQATELD